MGAHIQATNYLKLGYKYCRVIPSFSPKTTPRESNARDLTTCSYSTLLFQINYSLPAAGSKSWTVDLIGTV